MDEAAKNIVTKGSAAAVGALVGTAAGGPVGGVIGAAIAPALEPIMSRVWDELASDSRASAQQVLVEASTHTGTTPEQFAVRIRQDEQRRLLGGIAFSAGSRTRNRDKIRGLGRALADGVLAEDDAKLDESHLILRAIDDLEAPHIVVLEFLVNYHPGFYSGGDELRAPSRVDDDQRDSRLPRRRPNWTVRDFDSSRPGFRGSVPSLLGTLQRHGLAVDEQDVKKVLERYQKDVRAAARSTKTTTRQPEFKTRDLETRWNATDLGERVLDYLVAEQDSQAV